MAHPHARRCGLNLQCRMPEGRADRCTQYRALFRLENTVLWEEDMLKDHSLLSTVLRNAVQYAAVAAVVLALLSVGHAAWAGGGPGGNEGADDRGAVRLLTTVPIPGTAANATNGKLYSFEALVGFQGRGCADVIQPNCCHPFLLEALLLQWPYTRRCASRTMWEHTTLESNKSDSPFMM